MPLPVTVAWPLVCAVSAPLVSLMVTVSGSVSVFGSPTDRPSKDGTAVIAVSVDAAVITGGGSTMTVPVTVRVCAASG